MSKLRNIPAYLWRGGLVRRANVVLGAVAVGLVTACSVDQATAPEPGSARAAVTTATSSTTSGSTLVTVAPLTRTTPLARPITGTIILKGSGGTLKMPEAGLTVTIPRGAVGDTTLRITVTALPGAQVAYDFQPHGARFAVPLKILQNLGTTTWASNTGRGVLEANYFASPSQLSASTGTAVVDERIPAAVAGSTLSFDVPHFSGYLVSWGRR